MHQIEQDTPEYQEDEIERVHVYMIREPLEEDEEPPPKRAWRWGKWEPRRIVSCLAQLAAVLMLSGMNITPPTQVITTNIAVPAHFLPVQHIQASANIVATGVRTIQATAARGVLTIYNGAALVEQLPAGFVVTSSGGVEIATDQAVTIPAANLPAAGVAQVSAHAVQPGAAGNIEAAAIHQQDGSSLVIKNLAAFSGGQDARTETFVTTGDQARAITSARQQVAAQQPIGLMAKPCSEQDKQQESNVSVTLTCQLVTYNAPAGVKIVTVMGVVDKSVVLRVQLAEMPL